MADARRRWIAIASSLAGVVLLGALAAFTPWRLLAQRAIQVPWPGWVGATLAMSATYALRAGRLHAEWGWHLRPRGMGYRECLQVTLLHNAAINLLPMRSGEASYAVLLHRRWGVGLGDAAASLLWLRLQDAIVLGVLGLAVLVPAPLPGRLALAAAAIVFAATAAPWLVRTLHVHARRARARAHAAAARRGHRAWHLLARVAGAFRAARGGRRAWAFAVSNWVLKLGVVAALLAPLADLPPGRAFAGALGGELAAVLPLQAPAGVGTYEAGVALGAQVRSAGTSGTSGTPRAPGEPGAPAGGRGAPPSTGPVATAPHQNADNARLLFGAALTVHALMIVVALSTAIAFSLIVRPVRARESP